MRVLIIEDEHNLSHVIKKGLVEQGFAVDQVFDGEEGLYMASSEPYDIIILDIMLPKKDGISVCKDLREKKFSLLFLCLLQRL